MKFEDRVVVYEFKKTPCTQGKPDDDLARLEILAGSGDHTVLDQGNHALGNQFAVYPKVLAIAEKGRTASGIPPTPVCRTAPSSIRPATLRAMATCISVTAGFLS